MCCIGVAQGPRHAWHVTLDGLEDDQLPVPGCGRPDELRGRHPVRQQPQDARLARYRLQRKGGHRSSGLGEHAATVAQGQQPGIRAGEARGHGWEGDVDGCAGRAS